MMDKQKLRYLFNGTLLSHKKEHVTTTWKNINKSRKHTDRQKADRNEYIFYVSIDMKFYSW